MKLAFDKLQASAYCANIKMTPQDALHTSIQTLYDTAKPLFYCMLYAPKKKRDGCMLIAGLYAELMHIAQVTTDPQLGAIRMQWWKDALAARHQDDAPLTAAIKARDDMPLQGLLDMIEAQQAGLSAPSTAWKGTLSYLETIIAYLTPHIKISEDDLPQFAKAFTTAWQKAEPSAPIRIPKALPLAVKLHAVVLTPRLAHRKIVNWAWKVWRLKWLILLNLAR